MPRASRRPPGGLWLRAGFAWLSYSCVRACAACARINGGANSKWHLQQSVASVLKAASARDFLNAGALEAATRGRDAWKSSMLILAQIVT